MNGDDPGRGRDAPPDPEPPDAGEPILELADFGHSPSRSFLDRLRGRLNRRMASSNVVSFAWHAPAAILIEFLKLIFGLFAPPDPPKGDSR